MKIRRKKIKDEEAWSYEVINHKKIKIEYFGPLHKNKDMYEVIYTNGCGNFRNEISIGAFEFKFPKNSTKKTWCFRRVLEAEKKKLADIEGRVGEYMRFLY